MKIIGLTGGIGSGKSTVSDYLVSKGFHVLDADKISRELVLPGSDTLIELVSVFGKEILLEDGSLNRGKLGKIVFSDPENKALLDKIMHSRILENIYEKIVLFREEADNITLDENNHNNQAPNKVVFIDAALLFETGLDKSVSEIWVVDVDDETRIQRIMERDGLNRDEISIRISSQMGRHEKNERANEIIYNSGDLQELYKQVDALIKKL